MLRECRFPSEEPIVSATVVMMLPKVKLELHATVKQAATIPTPFVLPCRVIMLFQIAQGREVDMAREAKVTDVMGV
jgi:hypothetical protein